MAFCDTVKNAKNKVKKGGKGKSKSPANKKEMPFNIENLRKK